MTWKCIKCGKGEPEVIKNKANNGCTTCKSEYHKNYDRENSGCWDIKLGFEWLKRPIAI